MKYGRLEIITKQLSRNLALDRGDWRDSRTGGFIPAKYPSVPHFVEVFGDPTAYLNNLKRTAEYFVSFILRLLVFRNAI